MLTDNDTVSDDERWKRHSESGSADSKHDRETAETCDLTKGKSLHHRAAYQAETAGDRPVKVEDQARLGSGDAEARETLREDEAETLLHRQHSQLR